ncbi:zinc ribbon domain-containing protein [uncultured Desulfobacter sp.]|uniref:zinc ribbon domain-containing protein n=1 Tax=uncultured Desulfobacter sp. TaxID=240139 RepID=UPI002AA7D354|nr:zinc ribbon domain-containing protein [uncultured Desulfobacter sp.]
MSGKDFDLLHAARTEDLEDSQISKLAVIGKNEKEIIGKLKYSGSHLLQGARGIGKSMLLKEAEAELDREFNDDRNLAIYVNFKTSTLLEGVKADNKSAFQVWVGAKILQSLYEKLISMGIINENDLSDPFKRIFGVKTIYGMKETLQEKIHLLQQLSKDSNKKEIINKLGDDFIDKVNDITYITEIIKEIINEYQLNRVVFLFDEAAHTFIPEQQEIFFEIFKLIHGGKVAVKAAVYPSITAYGKNFEIGHDAILIPLGAFEPGAVGRESSRKVYRELIGRRIPQKGKLRKEIFSKGEVLDQCIHLASGNPRAFLHLFNRVYDRGYTERALLLSTQDYVDQELIPYHLGLAKRLPKYSHHVKLGLDVLKEYIIPEISIKNNREKKTKYQSAFFTLQRDMPPNLKLALDLLCYSGILSKQGTIKISSRKTGQRYMVHLALMFTEKAFVTNKFSDVIKMISLTDYREFNADDPNFNKYLENLKNQADECQKCSSEIPANAKFCPQCGTKVEEKSIVGALLDDSVREISISSLIADRIEPEFPLVGDVVHATRSELMQISYIKEVRSRMIKNAADEYISG